MIEPQNNPLVRDAYKRAGETFPASQPEIACATTSSAQADAANADRLKQIRQLITTMLPQLIKYEQQLEGWGGEAEFSMKDEKISGALIQASDRITLAIQALKKIL